LRESPNVCETAGVSVVVEPSSKAHAQRKIERID
jgi:hypothetical protein